MAGFVQIIEYKTSRIDEVIQLVEEMRAKLKDSPSVHSMMICGDRDSPGTYLSLVEFESYEAAMANSNRPETMEMAKKMAELCDGPRTFRNVDILRADG